MSKLPLHEHQSQLLHSSHGIHVVQLIELPHLSGAGGMRMKGGRGGMNFSPVLTLNMSTVSKLSAFMCHHCFSAGVSFFVKSGGTLTVRGL